MRGVDIVGGDTEETLRKFVSGEIKGVGRDSSNEDSRDTAVKVRNALVTGDDAKERKSGGGRTGAVEGFELDAGFDGVEGEGDDVLDGSGDTS